MKADKFPELLTADELMIEEVPGGKNLLDVAERQANAPPAERGGPYTLAALDIF